jgi:hypothetical protein
MFFLTMGGLWVKRIINIGVYVAPNRPLATLKYMASMQEARNELRK